MDKNVATYIKWEYRDEMELYYCKFKKPLGNEDNVIGSIPLSIAEAYCRLRYFEDTSYVGYYYKPQTDMAEYFGINIPKVKNIFTRMTHRYGFGRIFTAEEIPLIDTMDKSYHHRAWFSYAHLEKNFDRKSNYDGTFFYVPTKEFTEHLVEVRKKLVEKNKGDKNETTA